MKVLKKNIFMTQVLSVDSRLHKFEDIESQVMFLHLDNVLIVMGLYPQHSMIT